MTPTTATPQADERLVERWRRRALTFTAYAVAAVVLFSLLPLLLLGAVVRDALVDRRFPLVRVVAMGAVYLACETAGLIASAVLLLGLRLWPGEGRSRYLQWHYQLQAAWAGTLFRAMRGIFGLHVVSDFPDQPIEGPVLVFIRHASVADTLLPAVFVAETYGLRLRYVLKRELLWDPCLDVVGQRLPNVFVRRTGADPQREIAGVRRLAQGLGRGEGILIYPEGTRFTPAKRERRLEEVEARGDTARLARARLLRHVLPPRLSGPIALLEECPDADVLFVAHTGFEGIEKFGDTIRGGLIGRTIRTCAWPVPRVSVPVDREARGAWLDAQWARVDDWIDAQATDARMAT